MKAKKLLLFTMLAALGTSAQAQIVSSQSNQVIVTQEVKPKKPRKPIIGYAKLGAAYDICSEEGASSSNIGYEVGLGLKSPIGNEGAFWGIEAGGTSNRYLNKYEWESSFSLYGTPYVGWQFPNGTEQFFAPFIGPFVCYGTDNLANADWRAGLSLGANYWFSKHLAVGVNYKVDLLNEITPMHKIVLGLSIGF